MHFRAFQVPFHSARRKSKEPRKLLFTRPLKWLRGPDLNRRPSGYEPDELPGCSTPRSGLMKLPEIGQVASGNFTDGEETRPFQSK